MTTARLGVGHCCVCSGVCGHLGPIRFCDDHKPQPVGVPAYMHTPPTGGGSSQRDTDAGSLAFHVRDLMAAAGYRYTPTRDLHGQVLECGQLIENTRSELEHEIADRKEAFRQHAAEVRRLNDLVTELRRQLVAALRLAQRHGASVDLPDDPAPSAVLGDIEVTVHE